MSNITFEHIDENAARRQLPDPIIPSCYCWGDAYQVRKDNVPIGWITMNSYYVALDTTSWRREFHTDHGKGLESLEDSDAIQIVEFMNRDDVKFVTNYKMAAIFEKL